MALAIATNNAALQAAAAASSVNRDMETSMARLSSGKRINSAADDAAGVAISSRLSAEIRGTDQAIRNSLDGQAMIDTAEGAHNEIENILQRMREVAVQAANDTNNDQDRANLQAEMNALVTEIDRIAGTTTWAGEKLMEADTNKFSFQVGAATGSKNQIEIDIAAMGSDALGLGAHVSTGLGIRVVSDTEAEASGVAKYDAAAADDADSAADTSGSGSASESSGTDTSSSSANTISRPGPGEAVGTYTGDLFTLSDDLINKAFPTSTRIDSADYSGDPVVGYVSYHVGSDETPVHVAIYDSYDVEDISFILRTNVEDELTRLGLYDPSNPIDNDVMAGSFNLPQSYGVSFNNLGYAESLGASDGNSVGSRTGEFFNLSDATRAMPKSW